MKISRDPQRAHTTAISVGYNIFNTTSTVNVGEMLSRHGGGGHRVVGSCRVPEGEAGRAVDEILRHITEPAA